jgi:hypothetical protein
MLVILLIPLNLERLQEQLLLPIIMVTAGQYLL